VREVVDPFRHTVAPTHGPHGRSTGPWHNGNGRWKGSLGVMQQNRRTFLKSLAAGGAAATTLWIPGRVLAADPPASDLQGLRQNIDHVVVIYQENRSFDHYFGAYRNPNGNSTVANLLDSQGNIDTRFTGLQKNPAGIPYNYLPVPQDIAGFYGALLENRPFHLAPYLPATDNVTWDPTHNFYRMFAQVDGGRMDQFVALALNAHAASSSEVDVDATRLRFALSKPSGAVVGFYTRDDIPNYHRLADEYVLFDNFFQAMSGGSTGNALYLVAARSAVWQEAPARLKVGRTPTLFDLPYDKKGILINNLPPINGPTETAVSKLKIAPPPDQQTYPSIGDRLDAANISWAWYNENWNSVKPWALKTAFDTGDGSAVVETPNLYVPHHNPFQYYPNWQANVRAGRMRDTEDFSEDLKSGKLPQVSFIKATGIHDEHPADSAPRWGETWVMDLLRALGDSPAWSRTAVIVTYDEGGGFWDHVAPPQPDAYGCGTRVPALLISPFAQHGYVDHKVGDTTSVLAFITARFGLQPLQQRDARAYPMLDGLDFSQKPREPAFG
jgi:phospholipase C